MIRTLVIVAALAFGAASAVLAQTASSDMVKVREPWARATAGSVTTGAVYMTLIERGAIPDKLVAASSPMAGAIEIHAHTEDDGVMHMHQMPTVDVTAGRSTVLAPGSMHLMLLDLRQRLVEGQTFPLSLRFANAGTIDVTVRVEKVGAKGPSPAAAQ